MAAEINKSSKRDAVAAELEADQRAAPAPVCRRDKLCVLFLYQDNFAACSQVYVSKLLAYELGMADLWKQRWDFRNGTLRNKEIMLGACRLSYASYNVSLRKEQLEAMDPTCPKFAPAMLKPTREQRALPFAGLITIHGGVREVDSDSDSDDSYSDSDDSYCDSELDDDSDSSEQINWDNEVTEDSGSD